MNKIKEWIVSHKVISIIIASVLAVGIALSIALPLALACRHSYEWVVATPAGFGVDMKQREVCSECGNVKQSKTIADTKLESHKTLVMVNVWAHRLNKDNVRGVVIEAYILNGTLNKGDKLKIDGYEEEFTVSQISKGSGASAVTILDSVDYNETEKIEVLFEEYIEGEDMSSILKSGAYVTKSDVPVQRYSAFTLNVSVPSSDNNGFACCNGLRLKLCLPGDIERIGTVSNIVNSTNSAQGSLVPGKSGTLTFTLIDEQSAIVWEGVTVKAVTADKSLSSQSTYFNGTITGVLPE